MSIEKGRLGRNFGRQAVQYERHARVQRTMAAQLASRLQALTRPPARILEIGCGTGYLTRQLREIFPEARIIALDLALATIQEAKRQLGFSPRLAWLVADGEQPLRGRFDLITSNSVFQWFNQPAQTCRRYWEQLNPGGSLVFATLGPATFQELALSLERVTQKLSVSINPLIPARGFAGVADWQRFLFQAGFALATVEQQPVVEAYPTVMNFLKAIQGMGATRPRPAFLSRRLLTEMIAHYEAAYRVNGVIPVTYEIIWAQAHKAV